MELIDSHCHLDLLQFDPDRLEVMERATAAGVRALINPSIDLNSCLRVLALADRHELVYAAVGIHPNDCDGFDSSWITTLQELASHDKVVAIGEIGLDYYWKRSSPEVQKRALRAQLELAADASLPVILHCRNGSDDSCVSDLLWEMAQLGPAIRTARGPDTIIGVWHAFSGHLEEAHAAYGLGLVLGMGGPVTYQNARRLHQIVPELDLDRLILETDAPYLAPHPHRGQRNEPGLVGLVAEKVAALVGMAPEDVAARTSATANRCFAL